MRRAFRDADRGPSTLHAHRGVAHVHPGCGAHLHVAKRAFALRPLIVGVVHGLAGSGALTALVLARMPSTPLRIAYIALFGIGSVVGMTRAVGAGRLAAGAAGAPPVGGPVAVRDRRRGDGGDGPRLGLARHRSPVLIPPLR